MSKLIESIKNFLDLTPEVENDIAAFMVERSFRRGDRIEVNAGKSSKTAYFVEHGLARVFFLMNGTDHTITFSNDGEFVLIDPVRIELATDAVTYIEFLEPTVVTTLNPEKVREAIEKRIPGSIAAASPFVMSGMISHIRQLEERVFVLQNLSARQRYNWMAERYPRILERASITQISSFLGLTKETLYRIRSDKYNGK